MKKLMEYINPYNKKIEDAPFDSPSKLNSPNCTNEALIEVQIHVKQLNAVCLHHQYNTPVIEAAVGESKIGFKQFADHLALWGTLGVVEITDMTNYPSTISPLEFPMRKTTLEELSRSYSFDKLAILRPPSNSRSFEMQVYESSCPLRAERNKNEGTLVTVRFDEVWTAYVHDLTLRRAMNYILDQFLPSLSPVEVYVFSLMLRENAGKGVKGFDASASVDFTVPKEFTKLEVISVATRK